MRQLFLTLWMALAPLQLWAADGDGRALERLRAAAFRGDAAAQIDLGLCYERGSGVAQNDGEAARWYRLAAEQGDAIAQRNLGWMYENGRGVARDERQAVVWYSKSAAQGFAGGQVNLGYMYERGRGVPISLEEAAKLYHKAANQADSLGMTNLGWLYVDGRGVPQNYSEALKWTRMAAMRGHARAQNNLGWLYQNGRGVAQSDREAASWYRKAAAQGDNLAKTNLANLIRDGRLGPPTADPIALWKPEARKPRSEGAHIERATTADDISDAELLNLSRKMNGNRSLSLFGLALEGAQRAPLRTAIERSGGIGERIDNAFACDWYNAAKLMQTASDLLICYAPTNDGRSEEIAFLSYLAADDARGAHFDEWRSMLSGKYGQPEVVADRPMLLRWQVGRIAIELKQNRQSGSVEMKYAMPEKELALRGEMGSRAQAAAW